MAASSDGEKSLTPGDLEQLAWRVVSGLKQLDVNAQLGGTVKAPKLVGLKAVVGKEVAKAEAMARGAGTGDHPAEDQAVGNALTPG